MALQRPWPITAAGWLYIVHGFVAGIYCALLLTTLVVTEVLSGAGRGAIQGTVLPVALAVLLSIAFVLSGRSLLRGAPLGVARLGSLSGLIGLFGGAYLVVTGAPLTAFASVAYCLFLAVVSRVHDLPASIEWLRALHQQRVQPGT